MFKKYSFLTLLFIFLITLAPLSVNAETYSSGKVHIEDEWSALSEEDMNAIIADATEFSEITGYNVGFVISYDIGTKNEVEYGDDIYDDVFRINTDGVLFLINNDTLYDYIGTSGEAILMFDDNRLDITLDNVYDPTVDGNYVLAFDIFTDTLLDYYYRGIPDSNEGYYVDENTSTLEKAINYMPIIFMGFIGFLIVGIISYVVICSSYKFKSAPSARCYTDRNETLFRDRSDVFLRQYTTSHKISSSSGGSSGRSGGSSVHRSRSGGSHGGRSRRR